MTRQNSTSQLPSISLKSNHSKKSFVESLHHYGFAALDDHPLDMTLVRKIYRTWNEFFESDIKYQFEVDPDNHDGYFSTQNAESAKGFTDKDFKEYYHYYPWGRCPEQLRDDIQEYYAQAQAFSIILLKWIDQFSPTNIKQHFSQSLPSMINDSSSSLLRILRYPPIGKNLQAKRAAPHEDINLLTILPAADGPGLQILDKQGNWLSAHNQENQVLVNTGDMLQEVSRGYYPSTTHRVATPAGPEKSKARMSLPLFLHPRANVILSERYTAKAYFEERLAELNSVQELTQTPL